MSPSAKLASQLLSDRGSQHTSREFRALLDAHGLVQSLSWPRQCWDNAVAESFFSTLKQELVHRQTFPTRATARRAIFEFIEVFYNRCRLHSTLNHSQPVRRIGARPFHAVVVTLSPGRLTYGLIRG
jgi:putative transposase